MDCNQPAEPGDPRSGVWLFSGSIMRQSWDSRGTRHLRHVCEAHTLTDLEVNLKLSTALCGVLSADYDFAIL